MNATEKDPNTAFLIEFIGGFFGLLGLGYFYVGQSDQGLVRLVAWLVYVAVAWVGISLLSVVLIGCLCIPLQLAIQVAVPYWSANELKKSLQDI